MHMTVFIRNHALAIILAVCALGTAGLTYPAYANIGSNAGSGQARSDAGGDTQERNGLREGEQGGGLEAREAARTQRLELHFVQQSEKYNTLGERRATIVNTSEERRVAREQQREERRARLERLGGYGARVTEGMERVLAQLADMATRVEGRIARFDEAGIEVSAAELVFEGGAEGVGVHALIDVARADVTVLANLLAETLESDEPKVVMADVREAATLAKESIRLVHGALRDTVVELSAAVEVRSVDEEDVTTGDANGDDSAENSETSE